MSATKENEAQLQAYKAMQKATYENPNRTPEELVGFYDWHQTVPYETLLLYERGDIRFPLFPSTSNLRALDFGCGPGRMIGRMKSFFRQVDGADISQKLLDVARKDHPDSAFFHTSGDDLGGAPKGAYNFIYSTIALQHIAVHAIRMRIFAHMAEALAPGGKICLQFCFNRLFPLSKVRAQFAEDQNLRALIYDPEHQHARWHEDRTNAQATNSGCDCGIGAEDLPRIQEDFSSLFDDVRFWFFDFTHHRPDAKNARQLADIGAQTYWATHYLFVHAVKKPSLE